ncbi:hypothetical protein HBI56_004470 [Parastagonospora nodorum]|uniref:Uncharacterized protein n=1 Tax=Phaeosphaeria nodorum (strain SN15 / ATCC MYA-4574 / FGSC 10173) TaxID=321614 RepID=A0A7U2EQN8_PHANO|nr:hypothetical protein HBH56_136580 [Parastagonospora nodorum]QRC91271.1 hypothetical protein JI435_401160 [Parastagonospora nodorum SN15]KAH3928236.1 hypothetical protein HBH54_141710 [Parastagonospora nodorum]KAH3949082.1 hypothetical protein HBH53_091690 [Parastagonospora nodorum]KAH3982722.1 hypothetical protein HBH51_036390 [Parastagonospora nodorum]
MFRHALAYAQARSHPFLSPPAQRHSPLGPCHALPSILAYIVKIHPCPHCRQLCFITAHLHQRYIPVQHHDTLHSIHAQHTNLTLLSCLPDFILQQYNGCS